MVARTDADICIFSWGDVYRAFDIQAIKKLMNYGAEEFEQDWELAIALSLLMARPDNRTNWEPMLDDCFMRIHAYLALNPQTARPSD